MSFIASPLVPHLTDHRFTDHANITPRAWAKRTVNAVA
jgi:hypothetical protein